MANFTFRLPLKIIASHAFKHDAKKHGKMAQLN